MAWNWYPPVPKVTSKLPARLHAHADMDVITLLYQRTGDLDIINERTSTCSCMQALLIQLHHGCLLQLFTHNHGQWVAHLGTPPGW